MYAGRCSREPLPLVVVTQTWLQRSGRRFSQTSIQGKGFSAIMEVLVGRHSDLGKESSHTASMARAKNATFRMAVREFSNGGARR